MVVFTIVVPRIAVNPPGNSTDSSQTIQMSRGIFHDLLLELYEGNPAYKVDVVGEKRKKFHDSLMEANEALSMKDYPRALKLYQLLVTLLMTDVYSDELKLNDETVFYIKCCFAYCHVETSSESDPMLNIVLMDLMGSDRNELLPWMIKLQLELVEGRWYSATQQYLAMKIIERSYTPDQEPSETKKMFKDLLPSNDKIMKDAEGIFETFMSKLVKEEEEVQVKQQGTQTGKTKMNTKSIQTDKLKRKHAEVQVNIDHPHTLLLQEIKTKLDKEQEKTSKSLTSLHNKVTDINSKLIKEYGSITTTVKQHNDRRCEKYEDEIERLKKALQEAERRKEWEMQKNLEMQKLLLGQISDKYNCQMYIGKYLIQKCDYMVSYLNNLIKHLTPTSIPNVNSVKQEIKLWQGQRSTANSYMKDLTKLFKEVMLDVSQAGESNKLKNWPEQMALPKEDNLVLSSFIPAIQNILESENKLAQVLANWNSPFSNPKNGMPLYKDTYMVNMAPPMASMRMVNYGENAYSIHQQYLACAMAPNFAMAPRFRPPSFPMTPNGPYMPSASLPGSSMPGPGPVAAPGARPGSRKPTPPVTVTPPVSLHSPSPSSSSSEDVGEASGYSGPLLNFLYRDPETNETVTEEVRDKIEVLLNFLTENLPEVSEADLLVSMLAVLEKHGGTFSDVHKHTILEDVKEILQSKRETLEALNKQIESSCTICFDEMKEGQMYNLPCEHKYHKNCIKTWLMKNSNCPICRTPAEVKD